MLNLDAIRKLVCGRHFNPQRDEGLRELGNPTPDEVVEMALDGLKSEDRNIRTLMTWVLGQQEGPRAAEGILRALHDPKRRVRRAAIAGARKFLDYPGIRDRLLEIACQGEEKPGIRGQAFYTGQFNDDTLAYLKDPKLRQLQGKALWFLLQLDLTDEIRSLLQGVSKGGPRSDAVLATRALSGYKIVNAREITDPAERKRIEETCEPAGGGVFYWVKRNGD